MSTSTSETGIVRGALNLGKFLALAYTLWFVSGAIMWTVIRPYYMPHDPEAYFPVLAFWFIATCLATWFIGRWY